MKTALALVALSLLLTGCTPTTPSTPDGPGDSAGGDAVAPCFVGQWDLDVARYEDDAEFFLIETGAPVTDLAISGTQVMGIAADGQVTLGTNLTATTTYSLGATTHTTTSSTTNLGLGAWSSSGPVALVIDDFSFSESTVSTSEPGAPEFSGCDLSTISSIDVQCEDDTLFLIGTDAPFGSYWTRR
jgi:hypothetical protein